VNLVALDAAEIRALADGRSASLGEVTLDWPQEDHRVLRYRREALDKDPTSAPYLLHVLLDGTRLAGRIGCHQAPEDGTVEIGYFVAPAYRGRGVATAMVGEFLDWLPGHAVRRVRAAVGPENRASLAVLARFGFEQYGEQWDDEDGRELLFEKVLSNVYTHGHHESVLRSHRWRTAENSAGYLLPHLRPGMRLLDVGCGPGTITMDLAERLGPQGHVTALEVTDEALGLARAEADRRGTATVDFVTGNVEALDLPDGAYDVVHAHQVLQHVADPVRALREMRRVCRPGGLVAARDSDYPAFAWHPTVPELDRWLEVYLSVARSNRAEPAAGRRLLSWARSAGFTDVHAGASTWCFATDVDRQWWGGLWADRVVDSALARQAVDRGVATEAELADIARGWRRWAQQEDGWFTVLHGEILARA
jgi:ubiquinone/menaquinone biosynthesis C-methylase UbiE/RimJ/RimL family protein N-acetyltransferase